MNNNCQQDSYFGDTPCDMRPNGAIWGLEMLTSGN
jgi:hypothetical protein